ncbi:MAG: hypothetical protein JW754_04550 [Candidatus Aenigmarchaeota archaeon]|nr:hypothetical protein [Candidatus Aenigmarchaeota archaeon]
MNDVIIGGISDKTVYRVKQADTNRYGGLKHFLDQTPAGSLVMLTEVAEVLGAVEVEMEGRRAVLTGKSTYFPGDSNTGNKFFFEHVLDPTDL